MSLTVPTGPFKDIGHSLVNEGDWRWLEWMIYLFYLFYFIWSLWFTLMMMVRPTFTLVTSELFVYVLLNEGLISYNKGHIWFDWNKISITSVWLLKAFSYRARGTGSQVSLVGIVYPCMGRSKTYLSSVQHWEWSKTRVAGPMLLKEKKRNRFQIVNSNPNPE